jgi:hypothetical protein
MYIYIIIYICIYMSVCIIVLQMLLAVYMWCFMIVSCLLLHLSVHLFSGSSVRLCHYASIDIPSVLSKFPPHVANINRSKTRPGFLWVHFILRKYPRLLLRLHSIEVNACNVSTPESHGFTCFTYNVRASNLQLLEENGDVQNVRPPKQRVEGPKRFCYYCIIALVSTCFNLCPNIPNCQQIPR